MISKLAFALSLTFTLSAVAAEPAVEIKKMDGGVYAVSIGGKPFADYHANFDGKLPKPFFADVRGPGGAVLSRRILKEAGSEKLNLGHKHHKGIWVAVDEVNGVRFWAEKGQIKTVDVETGSQGKAGTLHVTNHWLNPEGDAVAIESTKITIHPNRLLAYDITFKSPGKPVHFEDTKEGLFGFRMVKTMRENDSGHVENSAGQKGTKACWGKPADWIDYYGPVDGKTYGVTIMDHPGNFRKSRYHVRNYGLFSINPFGQKAYTRGKLPAQPYTIAPGKTLRLRYGMYFHEGDTKAGKVADAYEQFVKATK